MVAAGAPCSTAGWGREWVEQSKRVEGGSEHRASKEATQGSSRSQLQRRAGRPAQAEARPCKKTVGQKPHVGCAGAAWQQCGRWPAGWPAACA